MAISEKTNRYVVSSLDPVDIEQDLRRFLQYQTTFSDYNFEASGLATLTKLLAYNTLYNNVYDNFALNESFLDSAIKRQNVLSHANMLNYVARGYTSSTAKLNVTVVSRSDNQDLPEYFTLKAYTPFKAQGEEREYYFYTTSNEVAKLNGYVYVFDNLEVKEGRWVSKSIEFHGSYYETFTIEDEGVDINTITVKVYENAESSKYEVFTRASDIMNISGDSRIFFLRNNPQGRYMLQFGNGTFGKALATGNVVEITYLTCAGMEANNCKSFVFTGNIPSIYTVLTSCVEISAGGADPETTEEIRYNAPRYYATQNRCVTNEDYIYTIKALYGNAKAVNAWGGEDQVPPEYGKVFISVIPKDGETLSETEKRYIKNEILAKRKQSTTLVEFVDPDYVKVGLDVTVYYNTANTALNTEDLQTAVFSTIDAFNERNLVDYGSILRFSKLSTEIDECNPAIMNNSTNIFLYKEMTNIALNSDRAYEINFYNPIYKPVSANESIISTGFECPLSTETCYLDDDPIGGTVNLFYYSNDGTKVYIKSVGTIDYEKGTIAIESLNIQSVEGNKLTIRAVPSSNDVASTRNTFVLVDMKKVSVTALPNKSYLNYIQVANK